jgi:hypothetical protein
LPECQSGQYQAEIGGYLGNAALNLERENRDGRDAANYFAAASLAADLRG